MINSIRKLRSQPGRRTVHADRGGNVLVLATLLLVFIFAMVAFAVDVGYIVHIDTEMQRTADACALAAVAVMPDEDAALAVAQTVAVDNANAQGPPLEVSDCVFGDWDRDTATFTPVNGGSGANAVRVILRRTEANGNPLQLFFARVLSRDAVDVQVESIAMFDNGLCGPLIGIEWVHIPGDSQTDSYRSSEGAYWNQPHRDNGSVCSDGPILADGNPIIDGDANPGRGYQTTLEGGAIVTGNMSPRLRPLNLPPVDDSDIAVNNDNNILPPIQKGNSLVSVPDANGDFLVDGNRTYNMPPGRYYFRNLTLTGGSTLQVSGDTVIYLYGNMDTSGGKLVNQTQQPSRLEFYMTGGTALVTAATDFYGTIYAPNTDVTLTGGAQWYGAFVGKTLTMTGTGDIHYDEDLEFIGEVPLPNRIALVK